MNFLDIVIVGLLLFGGLNGYRNGLIKSVVAIASTFVATVVAIAFFKTLTPVLHSKLGIGKIIAQVAGNILTKPVVNLQPLQQGTDLTHLSLSNSLLTPHLRDEFNNMLSNLLNTTVGNTIHSIQDAQLQYFTLVLVSMLAFLLIFIATKWLLRVVGTILTKSIARSFFGSLNHSGGFLFGLASTAVLLSIFLAFIIPLATIYPVDSVSRLIGHSILIPYFIHFFSGLSSAAAGITFF